MRIRSTSGVEIPQSYKPQAVIPVITLQQSFHKQFGPTIRVEGLLGMRLGYRELLRITVCGTCRGKHNSLHTSGDQGIQKSNPLSAIIFEISRRLDHGFPDVSEGCEVDA